MTEATTLSKQQFSSNQLAKDTEILETHKELIEKKSREINLGWKLTPAILYFICALTGYSASLLFHVFWHDIFNDNCPLWANMVPAMSSHIMREKNSIKQDDETAINIVISDWRKNLIVTYKYGYNCKFYHAICLCSCLFGVIWCMLFARCASGIYAAQWLIIPPALIFQIIFIIILINTMQDFEYGYAHFVNRLNIIAPIFMNQTEMKQFTKACELVDYYLQVYYLHPNKICDVHISLRILSWTMTFFWICGLFFIILRIIVVNDFRLRKTIVYKIAIEHNISTLDEIKISTPPNISPIRKLYLYLFPNQSD